MNDFFRNDFFISPIDFTGPDESDSIDVAAVGERSSSREFFRLGAAGLVAVSMLFAGPSAASEMPNFSGDAFGMTLSWAESSSVAASAALDSRAQTVLKELVREAQRDEDTFSGTASSKAVEQAHFWASAFISELDLRGVEWMPPLINRSAFHEMVFEWWSGERKLTLYFDGDNISFIRVWGEDIDSEMKDGLVKSPGHFYALWQWLTAKPKTDATPTALGPMTGSSESAVLA